MIILLLNTFILLRRQSNKIEQNVKMQSVE